MSEIIKTLFAEPTFGDAVELVVVPSRSCEQRLSGVAPEIRTFAAAMQFKGERGQVCAMPDADGRLRVVLVGVGEGDSPFDFGGLPKRLPPHVYALRSALLPAAANSLALGWALGSYEFTRYRKSKREKPRLVWPEGCNRLDIERTARATFLVRDLINTPAADMGPRELANAAEQLAAANGAAVRIVEGDELLRENYPAIHAVGRASSRAPLLVDLRWGDAAHPKVTLVGKGVCFDTGGLDLKSDVHMKLMKKDMGGAAHVLGLSSMIMDAGLSVCLRTLIPAVENSVSGDAMRPLDVLATRKGLSVEVGNTDAEGRLVLCDAIADAVTEHPALLIDIATLTGAARVALGTEVPAMFCNDSRVAEELLSVCRRESDPMWRLPLHRPYRKSLDSPIADLNNVSEGGYGGAITAALFLEEFVGPGVPWVHIDAMAWNLAESDGKPAGGEAMGMRGLFEFIRGRFAT